MLARGARMGERVRVSEFCWNERLPRFDFEFYVSRRAEPLVNSFRRKIVANE